VAEVGSDVLHSVAPRGQAVAGLVQHRFGGIQRDNPAPGEPPQEVLGHPARPTSGVENRFAALEWKAVQHGQSPTGPRVGDPIVGAGVPILGHRPSVWPARAMVDGDPP
jgi:hypothetical protein